MEAVFAVTPSETIKSVSSLSPHRSLTSKYVGPSSSMTSGRQILAFAVLRMGQPPLSGKRVFWGFTGACALSTSGQTAD